ncbi:MAG: hypothetical protein MZV64_72300 [Ignavibacteriales bacterium]|nr:hypothetical protein [Ignavibacteriales bacterium]
MASSEPPRRSPTAVPGPRSRALAARLAAVESRNVTCLAPAPDLLGARRGLERVGRRRQPLRRPRRGLRRRERRARPPARGRRRIARQAGELLHAMGDVHPARVKVELLEALARAFPAASRRGRCSARRARMRWRRRSRRRCVATGRPGVVAFEGAYHGAHLRRPRGDVAPCFREPFCVAPRTRR